MKFQYEYDEITTLQGDIEFIDDEFDHEFGSEPIRSVELKNFNILVYPFDLEINITYSMLYRAPKLYAELEKAFIKKAEEQWEK